MREIDNILAKKTTARVKVYTLGKFEVWVDGQKLSSKDWGRDKSIQLFQFLFLARNRRAMHKDQIVDKLWEDDLDDQGFKVALHGINKALEPSRKSHSETKYVVRVGHTYQLNLEDIWVDAIAFEALVNLGNQNLNENPSLAEKAFRESLAMHEGSFLPDRIYEDWTSDERERIQLLFLSTCNTLAELIINENPNESIQLCQQALLLDVAWEEAYRIQMEAYFIKGNRPMAIKTYQVCEKVLQEELGIKPLPDTKKMYYKIVEAE
ncbi:transcriptional regulator [Lacihabitans sp. LS3-19]|uniref:AfsR/SARP family transcriptional regulator n=1 Tax=Lacihabitans sp. LS3-19 TaxID=2487335 RepID=UPI0020CD6D20|nr:bacterial transcriptional activator domain-containing protein [Lacihabitans sp. LS3-19]MCP9766397.1 transcriptional regulator [Lacihabitans sp. LS3-19]